jgi:hypothetical protein
MVCGPCLWYIRPIQFHCIIFSLSFKEEVEEEEEEVVTECTFVIRR